MRTSATHRVLYTPLLMAVVSLCVSFSACAQSKKAPAPAPAANQFQSRDHSITLQYSSPILLCQQGSGAACEADVLNLCSGEDDTFEPVACFVYGGKTYDGYNFRSAALTLGHLGSARDEKACLVPPGTKGKPETINGIPFATSDDGQGAAGTMVSYTYYRTFHSGHCLTAVLSIATSNIGAMEPGAVKEFKAADFDKVHGDLKHVLNTLHIGAATKPPTEDRD